MMDESMERDVFLAEDRSAETLLKQAMESIEPGWRLEVTRTPVPSATHFQYYSAPPERDREMRVTGGRVAGFVLAVELSLRLRFDPCAETRAVLGGRELKPPVSLFRVFTDLHGERFFAVRLDPFRAMEYGARLMHPDQASFNAEVEKAMRFGPDHLARQRTLMELNAIRRVAQANLARTVSELNNRALADGGDYVRRVDAFLRDPRQWARMEYGASVPLDERGVVTVVRLYDSEARRMMSEGS